MTKPENRERKKREPIRETKQGEKVTSLAKIKSQTVYITTQETKFIKTKTKSRREKRDKDLGITLWKSKVRDAMEMKGQVRRKRKQ